MLREKVLKDCNQEKHVEIGFREFTLLQMNPLDQTHKDHVDKGFCHGILDLFDESARFVAVNEGAVLSHKYLPINRGVLAWYNPAEGRCV
jgi:hypothetical protein